MTDSFGQAIGIYLLGGGNTANNLGQAEADGERILSFTSSGAAIGSCI